MEKVTVSKLYNVDAVFFQELKNEVLDIINRVGWNNGTQIMLQTLDPVVEDWFTGVGKLKLLTEQDEKKYRHIQPSLKGTNIEKLLSSTPLPVYRSRIMKVDPKRCYSIHHDMSCRLHLAIKTNESCLFLFPELSKYNHIPVDRGVYLVDTRETHSFVNCGEDERVHIVMCAGG